MEKIFQNVDIKPLLIDFSNPFIKNAAKKLFQLEEQLPLVPVNVMMDFKGINRATVHGLSRVLQDEIPNYMLDIKPGGYKIEDSTDLFMTEQFIRNRINFIPIYAENETLVFALRSLNNSCEVKTIYSRDLIQVAGPKLKYPIFNPTFEIGFLQPGKSLIIEDIYIKKGIGRKHAAFNLAVKTHFSHLDIEQYPTDKKEYMALSGYKQSSMTSDPRHHRLGLCFPAVPLPRINQAVRTYLKNACRVIIGRIQNIQKIYENFEEPQPELVLFSMDEEKTKAIITIKDETHTIGNLLKTCIYEMIPDISFVGYQCIPHKQEMVLTIIHKASQEDLITLLEKSIQNIIQIFQTLEKNIDERIA
ncbi:BA71V-H359L (j1L) [African swine fever virus]|uniref:DNA-directed RNA polymerase RPB3-11 homolog n=1 Tax=African swine fever virus TaxID=10497 RepID=A0A0C5B293_ASF|nr:BA71V-H359L (j1L) [African swine fever virus]AJL34126.1 BA71V-H359L (j1L) [African swine fever virus]QRY19139.1 BA71V-H359L (j1L) [African swine fever virus]CAD7112329.1 H359L CDS [African swine fever virus]